MRSPHLLAAMAVVALLGSGCGKGKEPASAAASPPKAPGAPHVQGTTQTDDVVGAWKREGLEPESFVFVDPAPYRAGYCAQGRVKGIEAIICEYVDDESLDRGKKVIHGQWEKQRVATGVVTRSKRTLLAVADDAADPSGKVISRLVKTFTKL